MKIYNFFLHQKHDHLFDVTKENYIINFINVDAPNSDATESFFLCNFLRPFHLHEYKIYLIIQNYLSISFQKFNVKPNLVQQIEPKAMNNDHDF